MTKKLLLASIALASMAFAAPDSNAVAQDTAQTKAVQEAAQNQTAQEPAEQKSEPLAEPKTDAPAEIAKEAQAADAPKDNPEVKAEATNEAKQEETVKAEAQKEAEPAQEVQEVKTENAEGVAEEEQAKATEQAPEQATEQASAEPAQEDATQEALAESSASNEAPKKEVAVKTEIEEEVVEEIVYVQPKRKLVEQGKFSFDVLASFEIQAGKTLWITEDDEDGNNLEEWWGRANLATVVETDNFIGMLALEFYPIDNQATKADLREKDLNDYYKLKEAWAWQRTKYVNFKLGRWDNTDKNGDFFGGYIDGYLAGFRSTQESENQLQFGFTPIEFMALNIGLISTGEHLNTGDLRLVFSFHDLPSLERLKVDIGYRSNLFDAVYDSDSDVRHNISLKGSVPLIKNGLTLFVEAALLGLDGEEEEIYTDKLGRKRKRTVASDWYTPITGGFIIETSVVDRIVLEAEYIAGRDDSPYKTEGKHVKDVLAAFYIEKALTDRFTLSAGVHSFGSTKDWTINGNLIGRIN